MIYGGCWRSKHKQPEIRKEIKIKTYKEQAVENSGDNANKAKCNDTEN